MSVLDTGTGWTVTRDFSTSPVTIGRDPRNSLQLDHPAVAAHQAELVVGEDVLMLKCLLGAGTISSDGQILGPSEEANVFDGSIVVVGPFRLEIYREGAGRLRSPAPHLTLDLRSPERQHDGADDKDDGPCESALVMFASAFLILRRYLGTLGSSTICKIQEPHAVVEYLIDPVASPGRIDELGDVLAALVTRVARLSCPIERWPT